MSALFRPVTRNTVLHSARTAIAVLVSILLASFVLKLPEFYWAPVYAVILLSATDPMKLAWQRFAGTALGAVFGALIATYLGQSWIVYGFGIFIAGIVSALLHVSTAYRFAAITLTIVMLVPHTRSTPLVAFHRFLEVSLGIEMALLLTVIWRLDPPEEIEQGSVNFASSQEQPVGLL